MLPNLLILGAMKAGTTSLYEYLASHPEVFCCHIKEPNFFSFRPGQPLPVARAPGWRPVVDRSEYEGLFAAAGDLPVRCEASTGYLTNVDAPARIAALVPEAKLVALLRDPVDRAYSNFLHLRRLGREPLDDLEAAVAAAPRRAREGWSVAFQYVRNGRYAEALHRYLDHVDPSQLRVYLFEDLTRDPGAVLRDLFGFVGVDPHVAVDTRVAHNPGGEPRSRTLFRFLNAPPPVARAAIRLLLPAPVRRRAYQRLHGANLASPPPLSPPARARLLEHFADDIEDLQRLLDRDLSAWLRAPRRVSPQHG